MRLPVNFKNDNTNRINYILRVNKARDGIVRERATLDIPFEEPSRLIDAVRLILPNGDKIVYDNPKRYRDGVVVEEHKS